MKFRTLSLIFLLYADYLVAQLYPIEYQSIDALTSDEYTISLQNWDFEQDSLGRIYMANTSGIILFDGTSANMVQGSGGVVFYSLTKDNAGRIYAAGENEIGILEPDSMGKIIFRSQYGYIEKNSPKAHRISELIAYENKLYFKTDSFIGCLSDTILTEWSFSSNKFLLFSSRDKGIVAQNNDSSLINIHDNRIDTLELPEIPLLINMYELPEGEYLLISRNSGLFRLSGGKTVPLHTEASRLMSSVSVNTTLRLSDSVFIAGTFGSGIIFFDQKGKLLDHIGVENGLGTAVVYSLFLDLQNTLWISHDNGLSRMNYPVGMKQYSLDQGLEGTVLSFAEANNMIYAGTTRGVFFKDLDNNESFTYLLNTKEAWDIKHHQGSFFFATTMGLYVFDGINSVELVNLSARAIHPTSNKNILLIGMRDGVGKLVKLHDRWHWDGMLLGINHEVRSIASESDSVFWVSYEQVSRITFDKNLDKVQKIESFSEENGINDELYAIETIRLIDRIYFGTAHGILFYDDKSKQFLQDSLFFTVFKKRPRETWGLAADSQNRLWITSKRSNGPIYIQDNNILTWDTLPTSNLRGTEVWRIVPQNNGLIWFCTTNGLFQFNSNIQKKFDDHYMTLISKVEINRDSVICFYHSGWKSAFDKSVPEIPFRNNNIRFHYTSPSFYVDEKLLFSFKLEGYDEQWSEWSTEIMKEYTNLPPRSYTFFVNAINSYNKESETIGFPFEIIAPWFRTWWAYSIIGLFSIGILYTLAKYQKKRIEFRHKAEIHRQEQEIEREKKVSKRLRNIDRLKDEFLAHTSHDLRTPLHGIIGISESIYDKLGQMTLPEIRKNLAMVRASGKRLASLVDSILDYSRLKNKDVILNMKSVDLYSITEMVLNMSAPLVSNQKIQLINQIPKHIPLVRADENRLQQILYNLIGNAIKFTEKGSISVHAVVKDKEVEVSVKDTGIGIPEDKKDIIFDSFEQVELMENRDYIGTGLGLSISKKLVELHGGKIGVKSRINKGSTFFFTMPVSDLKTEKVSHSMVMMSRIPEEDIKINDEHDSEFRILVVDDEPINLQVLVNYLEEERYQVRTATNGKDALDLIYKVKFDLVLLDVMMPMMSGFEVSRKIREKYLLSELIVIFVTAKDQIRDIVEGLSYGGNDYISKPFSKEELLARIKTHLKINKINDSYARFIPHEFLVSLGRENIIDVQLGDQTEKEVTIVYSDIRDYTSIAEKLTPSENFRFLNNFLSRMGPVIRKNHGFILHYLGDGLMALFLKSPVDAIRASIEMLQQMEKLNLSNEQFRNKPIRMGTGMHTGDLVLGVLGDKERMDANVVSDAVNIAFRMEGLNKIYRSSVIISEETISKVDQSEFHFRFLGFVLVKGKARAIKIYELLDGDNSKQNQLKIETKEEFEKALILYSNKDFVKAAACFKNVIQLNPDDKAASLYLKSAARYMVDGVDELWTGVESFE